MLRIVIFFGIILFSAQSFAQQMPDQVPAFLRNEASQPVSTQPLSMHGGGAVVAPSSMQGGVSSEPAFLQQERLEQQQQQQQYQQQLQQIQAPQNQYQYQSANPDDASSVTMPPANYQPAPGDVPAFIQQQATQPVQQAIPAEADTIKTNKKEDVIQINFSDDQYKSQDDSQNADQARQYNAAPEITPGKATAANGELKEGSVYTPTPGKSSIADEKAASKNAVPEPEKSGTNMLRINFNKDNLELSDADKKALLPAVVTLKQNGGQKILIKSYTSNRDSGADTRRIGLLRVINIRDYLMKQGIDFSRTEVNIVGPELNKEDLDYIDIDKI